MPNAIAANACTPPMHKMSSAPDVAIAYSCGGCMPDGPRGGAHATTRATPATFGTSTVMIAEAISG